MNLSATEPVVMESPKRQIAWFNVLLRVLVGGAFVAAGALKIANPAKFAADVGNYRMLPHELNDLVAIMLPWIELTAGLLVLGGVWLRAAAGVIASLTVLFLFVIISALVRGLNIECGCFGTVGGRHIGLVNLVIDATLLTLAALLVARSPVAPVPKNSGPPPTQ